MAAKTFITYTALIVSSVYILAASAFGAIIFH
jgi:hypothetical protein